MPGPMHAKRVPSKGRNKIKNPGKLLKRLLSYVFQNYGLACAAVVVCIFISDNGIFVCHFYEYFRKGRYDNRADGSQCTA